MAKDKSASKDERRAAKKAAKESSSASSLIESAGVSKSSSKDKADKKEKKEKKAKLAERLLKEQQKESGTNVGGDGEVVSEDSEAGGEAMDVEKIAKGAGAVRPVGALVPFANPLADEKVAKKVFRGVKKGESPRGMHVLVCFFSRFCFFPEVGESDLLTVL